MEETLFGTQDKVDTAIQRLRTFEPAEGYFVAFSGGKDSQVKKTNGSYAFTDAYDLQKR